MSSNPTSGNFIFYQKFLKPLMSIFYRNVRYVLKTKNPNGRKALAGSRLTSSCCDHCYSFLKQTRISAISGSFFLYPYSLSMGTPCPTPSSRQGRGIAQSGNGRYASCGHAGGISCLSMISSVTCHIFIA